MKITYRELLELVGEQPLMPELDPAAQERIQRQVMKKIGAAQPAQKRHRKLRPALIAAAAVFVLSITAGAAYYVSHDNTKALFSQDPVQGGLHPVEMDDRSGPVIDEAARDYGLVTGGSSETAGETAVTETTVTLDNIMGFHSDYYNTVYVTVTVRLPEEQQAGLDPEKCGFGWMELQPTDPEKHFAGDGAVTKVQNTDGTISMMLCYLFRYEDVTGVPVTLKLENFNTGSERLEGNWSFDLDALELDALNAVDFDAAAFAEVGITPLDIGLSAFGGTLTMKGYLALLDSKFRAMVQDRYEDLDLDWEQVSMHDRDYLERLYERGVLTLEQLQNIYCIADGSIEYFGRDNVVTFRVALEYADGTVYEADTQLGAFPMSLIRRHRGELAPDGGSAETEFETYVSEDEELLPFLFDAPLDLSQAAHLVIEGVKIPLSA